jgi:guanylate kinase
MSRASHEMSHWAEYDYVVVNSDLDVAYGKIESILQVERLRRERQMWLSQFVRGLQRQLEK